MHLNKDSFSSTVDRYIQAWNVPEAQRVAKLEGAVAHDAYYCDGAAEVSGISSIAAMIESTYTQFPGAGIELLSPLDTHHRQGRFAWRLHDSSGVTIVEGIDVVRFNGSGLLVEILGFFGQEIATEETSVETFEWERAYPVGASRLFALMSDNALFAAMAPNVERIDSPRVLKVGAERVCHDAKGASWTEVYTSWAPGQSFSTKVDVETYPEELRMMVKSLDAVWSVQELGPKESVGRIKLTVELSQPGVKLFKEGGAANAIFEPLLDAWLEHLRPDQGAEILLKSR